MYSKSPPVKVHRGAENGPTISPRGRPTRPRSLKDSNYSPRMRELSRDFPQLVTTSASESEGANSKRKIWPGSRGYEKRRKGENAILRVYIGFPRPVQEFVQVRVFDFKASLLGRYNRTIRTFSRPLGPSEVGTHENILHFLPRFTRCIL